jgi:hypothetical protein
MGRRLKAEERAERLAVWRAGKIAKKSYARMAAELGLDPDVFRSWCLAQEKPRETVSRPQPNGVTRSHIKCLRCENPFLSWCKKSNRLCRDCSGMSVSPYTPAGTGDSGRQVWAHRS